MLGPSLRMRKQLEYPPGAEKFLLHTQNICLIGEK